MAGPLARIYPQEAPSLMREIGAASEGGQQGKAAAAGLAALVETFEQRSVWRDPQRRKGRVFQKETARCRRQDGEWASSLVSKKQQKLC